MNSFAVLRRLRLTMAPTQQVQKAEKDIPEVEDVKRLILPILRRHWDHQVELAVRDVLASVGALEDRLPTPGIDAIVHAGRNDEDRELLILALLEAFMLVIERRLWTPMETRRLAVIREGINELLMQGGQAAGFKFPLDKPRGAVMPLLSEGMLHLQVFGHVVSNRGHVERALRDALIDRRMRTEAGARAQESELARRLTAVLAADPSSDVLVGEPWLPPVVDAWAYSTYTMGGIVALLDARVGSVIAFNNFPTGPDDHTTAFCRHIHGKVIAESDFDAKVAEIRKAIAADDFAAFKKARPLSIKGSGAEAFERHRRAAVFPPFHWKCRTTAQRGGPVG